MPKNTNIQTHWVDVSSMVAKREISMIEKNLKIRQTLQNLGIYFLKNYLKRETSLHSQT